MARWEVEFYGSVEVEADDESSAQLRAEDEFDPFYNTTVKCLDEWCEYCNEKPATIKSPWWDDLVCQGCYDDLEEEHEEEEDEDSE